jgi:opacity protein-like surface antigen
MISIRSLRPIDFPFVLLLSFMPFLLGSSQLQAADPEDHPSGFSFHAPRIFFGAHAGMNFPQTKGDIFGVATRDLTLKKSDFRAPDFGADFGVYLHSHFAAVGSFDYSRTSTKSEYRYFLEKIGDSKIPINQTTRFSQWSLLGSLRYYPLKTGEVIGSHSWIPTRVMPYAAAGMGIAHYNFSQQGDFVDMTTYDINTDMLLSRNSALMTHMSAGLDIAVTSRILLNVEGRYSWSAGDISTGLTPYRPDYSSDSIDLNGLKVIGGIYFRF